MTSQIFGNIYLNEFDRWIKHSVKPRFYLRYGDDFIIITNTRADAERIRLSAIDFLRQMLDLEINHKNDIIVPTRRGIHFLGVKLYPTGRRLKEKIWDKAQSKLSLRNTPSYHGLVAQQFSKKLSYFDWLILQKL